MATTIKRHSTRDWRALCDSIVNQSPHHTTTGALSAAPWVPRYWGQLPSEHREALRSASAQYVIRSYETPIAWLDSEGRWVVPNVRYSTTTSAHQGVARVAIDRAVALGRGSWGDERSDERARELHAPSLSGLECYRCGQRGGYDTFGIPVRCPECGSHEIWGAQR